IFAVTSKMITAVADRRPQDPVMDSIKKA
ncbi:MAG TPA: transcriptional regulator, partial [Exiguobacterium sp.]|nr:transcriptional regulator [Exiguobacterium sp.]